MTTKLHDRLGLAKLLDCNKQTISNMVADKRLPKPINIGTKKSPNYRWSDTVIQKWIDEGCPQQAATEAEPVA